MEVKKIFKMLILAALSIICSSCQSTEINKINSLLQNSPDAGLYITNILKEKRIVFISENHATVDPILFISKNIDSFYSAGVRILFMEGGLASIPSSSDYGFFLFYPWTNAGWKYEELILAERIHHLNSFLPKDNRLSIITPETVGDYTKVDMNGSFIDILNTRDMNAFNGITSIMKTVPKEWKAIVFYGGSHGAKDIYGKQNTKDRTIHGWKPLGSYLAREYGSDFYSLSFTSVSKLFRRLATNDVTYQKNNEEYKVIDSEYCVKSRQNKEYSLYDAVIVDDEPQYGIYYQYIPTEENLRFMFESLRKNEDQVCTGINGKYRYDTIGQYLCKIYYLKMYYGEQFNYSLWNPTCSLKDALVKLGDYCFKSTIDPSSRVITNKKTIDQIRNYHQLMRESGIETYIETKDKNILGNIEHKMIMAQKTFPDDIWTNYWLAFVEVENGDYLSGLEECERIISNPLSSCLESLPRVYMMAIKCADKLGENEASIRYKEKLDSVYNEHLVDVTNYADVM